MITVKNVLHGKVRLTSPPAIAVKILETVKKDAFDFNELAAIIESDPALAARTLKLANSSFYNLQYTVGSIKKAVALLGSRAVMNIALSFVICSECRGMSEELFDVAFFWRRALTAAVAAELAASLVGAGSGNLFMLALLQDIGILAMHSFDPSIYREVMDLKRDKQVPLVEAERSFFGFDHQEMGAELLKNWQLPEEIYAPITYHHQGGIISDQHRVSVRLLHVANDLASFYNGPQNTDKIKNAKHILHTEFGIHIEAIDAFIESTAKRTLEILSMFEIPPGTIRPLSEILQDANQELSDRYSSCELLFIELKQTKERAENLARDLQEEINEHKQIIKALHESEQQFYTLCVGAPVGIFRSDSDGRLVYSNPEWEKITGFNTAQGLGQGWIKGTHPEDVQSLKRIWSEAVGKGGIFSHKYRLLTPKGQTIWVKALANPIRSADGAVLSYVGTLSDITEMEKGRQDMLKASKLDSLGVLAGGIAHDFNNILTGLFGNISLARLQLLNSPEAADRRLEDAEKSIDRATDLTRQFLTFAKGGDPVKITVIVNEIVKNSADFILHGSNTNCIYHLADDLWPVEVDEGQLSQVIHNLVLNATQSMKAGGTINISTENASSHLKGDRFIKITVADTGEGISDTNLQRIFDPYFTTKAQGNGLGLATCYSIIKRHGGKIRVESTVGKGSLFIISLPSSHGEYIPPRESLPGIAFGTGRVLVVDDNEAVRTVAMGILTELGYQAESVEDGAAAVDLYLQRKEEGSPFLAVILDLTIPGGMGGAEALERLFEIDPSLRAIVSSGYSNDQVIANYRDYGFSAYLIKPYRTQEMSKVMQDITEQIEL